VPAEEQVAHTAAYEVGDVVVLVKLVKHLQRSRIDVPA